LGGLLLVDSFLGRAQGPPGLADVLGTIDSVAAPEARPVLDSEVGVGAQGPLGQAVVLKDSVILVCDLGEAAAGLVGDVNTRRFVGLDPSLEVGGVLLTVGRSYVLKVLEEFMC
jgi:hypothetical protein